jgi:predicted metal-dependent hydrolase
MIDRIQFGSKEIEFSWEYATRKSLSITVTPDMQVLVKAPVSASAEDIKKRIRKRAAWIIRQQNFFLMFQPRTPEKKYVSGETHLYMGRQYQLKIVKGKEDMVRLKGRHIEVATANRNKVKQLVKNWYRGHARSKFNEIAAPLIHKFKRYQVIPSSIEMRTMQKRWGSCTPGGKLILNPELIKAPRGCIEYVIVHELCHLLYRDHTQKFLDLQTKEFRDWKKWKSILEKMLA